MDVYGYIFSVIAIEQHHLFHTYFAAYIFFSDNYMTKNVHTNIGLEKTNKSQLPLFNINKPPYTPDTQALVLNTVHPIKNHAACSGVFSKSKGK